MSSQKGNVRKARQQKYQNSSSFKNTKYEVSGKLKELNKMEIAGVCQHCKEKIEWKIKYKKYKALTAPRRCSKCGEKTVKRAYYIICTPCSIQEGVCAMCNKHEPIVHQPGLSSQEEASQKSQLQHELKYMSERERRSYLRKNLNEATMKRKEGNKLDKSEEDGEDSDYSDQDESFDLDIIPKSNDIDNVINSLSGLSTENNLQCDQLTS